MHQLWLYTRSLQRAPWLYMKRECEWTMLLVPKDSAGGAAAFCSHVLAIQQFHDALSCSFIAISLGLVPLYVRPQYMDSNDWIVIQHQNRT